MKITDGLHREQANRQVGARFQQLTTPTKRGHKDSSSGALSDGSISVDSCVPCSSTLFSNSVSHSIYHLAERGKSNSAPTIDSSFPHRCPEPTAAVQRCCTDFGRRPKPSDTYVHWKHLDPRRSVPGSVCKIGERLPLPLS